ncbi:hypothetical protein [Komagataeibacter medellinensis]|uniref:hypothetical protein n=1 Tax=Komagataeibacter medellinensis TaxID=1177712 RepID=UPI00129567CE|nr:hypothetical protein [Komagataeibacter medellinensis]
MPEPRAYADMGHGAWGMGHGQYPGMSGHIARMGHGTERPAMPTHPPPRHEARSRIQRTRPYPPHRVPGLPQPYRPFCHPSRPSRHGARHDPQRPRMATQQKLQNGAGGAFATSRPTHASRWHPMPARTTVTHDHPTQRPPRAAHPHLPTRIPRHARPGAAHATTACTRRHRMDDPAGARPTGWSAGLAQQLPGFAGA